MRNALTAMDILSMRDELRDGKKIDIKMNSFDITFIIRAETFKINNVDRDRERSAGSIKKKYCCLYVNHVNNKDKTY